MICLGECLYIKSGIHISTYLLTPFKDLLGVSTYAFIQWAGKLLSSHCNNNVRVLIVLIIVQSLIKTAMYIVQITTLVYTQNTVD